jgi:hypothetical protein
MFMLTAKPLPYDNAETPNSIFGILTPVEACENKMQPTAVAANVKH